MENMKETIARVVGMQTAKARRVLAEQTYTVLRDYGIGVNACYDGNFVVTVCEFTAEFLDGYVQIDPTYVPFQSVRVNTRSSSVGSIVTVLDGLALLVQQSFINWGMEELDDELWSSSRNGDDVDDSSPDAFFWSAPEKVRWTKSATPPQCCEQPMKEMFPEVWGNPLDALHVERAFTCPTCGKHRHVKVGKKEAIVLYAEVTPMVTEPGSDDDGEWFGSCDGPADGTESDWNLDLFYVPSDAYKTRSWTHSQSPPHCCGKPMTEQPPAAYTHNSGIFAERVFRCTCDSYRYVIVTDEREAALLVSEVAQW